MKIDYLPRALEALKDAPADVRKAFFKQVTFLAGNLHYPSLHAKKYDESRDRWQARVNKNWRFYFNIRATPTSSAISFLTPRNDYSPKNTRSSSRVTASGMGARVPTVSQLMMASAVGSKTAGRSNDYRKFPPISSTPALSSSAAERRADFGSARGSSS